MHFPFELTASLSFLWIWFYLKLDRKLNNLVFELVGDNLSPDVLQAFGKIERVVEVLESRLDGLDLLKEHEQVQLFSKFFEAQNQILTQPVFLI